MKKTNALTALLDQITPNAPAPAKRAPFAVAFPDDGAWQIVIARRTELKARIAEIMATVAPSLRPLESECKALETALRDELERRNGRPLDKGEMGATIATSRGSAIIEGRAIPTPPAHGAQVLKVIPR
jgi:hypothetical protein